MKVDVTFDFTTDTPNYWPDRNIDPDKYSPTLKRYHQILWSKQLPNGEVMELRPEDDYTYLRWKDFRLSSDSIIVELRYNKYIDILNQVYERIRREGKDVEEYYEDLLRKGYTIGGMIIFPQHPGSKNQNRGTNRDLWRK